MRPAAALLPGPKFRIVFPFQASVETCQPVFRFIGKNSEKTKFYMIRAFSGSMQATRIRAVPPLHGEILIDPFGASSYGRCAVQ
jgi:hypothetical protein